MGFELRRSNGGQEAGASGSVDRFWQAEVTADFSAAF
jgi:hypothetical protein